MKWWERRRKEKPPAPVVQVRQGEGHPFGALDRYVPLCPGEAALYRAIREAVPIVDAAVWKLARLCGGVGVRCRDSRAQAGLEEFFRTVDTGWGQRGGAVLPGPVSGRPVHLRPGGGRDCAGRGPAGHRRPAVRRPGAGGGEAGGQPTGLPAVPGGCGGGAGAALAGAAPVYPLPAHGGPALRGVPAAVHALSGGHPVEDLSGHRPELGAGGQPALRRGVQARRGGGGLCPGAVPDAGPGVVVGHAGRPEGSVRDFVAVGDVDIRVIGADSQVLDSQVPVRQILEQLVARTGIPPFMLGLSWSSTERMSAQQADLLTSEITAIRRGVEPRPVPGGRAVAGAARV